MYAQAETGSYRCFPAGKMRSSPEVRFEEVAPRQAEFGDIVTRVYKPVRAKHSQFVLVHDTLAIVADSEFSRYKDGTRSTGALAFLKGSYGTCRATAAR